MLPGSATLCQGRGFELACTCGRIFVSLSEPGSDTFDLRHAIGSYLPHFSTLYNGRCLRNRSEYSVDILGHQRKIAFLDFKSMDKD
jgi:hypothetical protein